MRIAKLTSIAQFLQIFSSVKTSECASVIFIQELLAAGGYNMPQGIHEVVALLACRLARWDDR